MREQCAREGGGSGRQEDGMKAGGADRGGQARWQVQCPLGGRSAGAEKGGGCVWGGRPRRAGGGAAAGAGGAGGEGGEEGGGGVGGKGGKEARWW